MGPTPSAQVGGVPALITAAARSEEVWFRSTTVPGGANNGSDLLSVGGDAIVLFNSQNIDWFAGGTNHDYNLPYPVYDGQWHQLVAAYDGSNVLTLYVDGQPFLNANVGAMALAALA